MKRLALRSGEHLAISPDAIKHDADGFFLLMGPDVAENEQHGSVAVVHVRGALSHFKSDGGDSYEAIVDRVKAALESTPKPSAVVFRIESPGGVVSGLNESVLKLQRMSKAASVRFVAFVDEMAASAAYAMSCACEEIVAPPSAIIGSVGVISTIVSQAKKDELDGVEFRLITSGARKADGHLHAPISSAAVSAETARNSELAAQFFALAGKARGVAPKKLAALDAGIFLSKQAKAVGLIDDVMSWDELVGVLDTTSTDKVGPVAPNEGNKTNRQEAALDKGSKDSSRSNKAFGRISVARVEAEPMSVKLDALIAKAEAALASEADPKRRARLAINLAQYEATQRAMSDDPDKGDDGDDDDDDDKKDKDDDGDDSKAKKAADVAKKAKAKAEAMKHRAKAAEHKQKAAESEEEAKKCEDAAEDGGDEEKSSAKLSAGAAAALAAQADLMPALSARIEAIEKGANEREKATAIQAAIAARRIAPHEAKTLAKKSCTFVSDYLEMRPHAIVNVDDDTDGGAKVPDGTPGAHLGKDTLAAIEEAVRASSAQTPTEQKTLRESLMAAHIQAATARANGAATRY
jgi:ClpP class serine protease